VVAGASVLEMAGRHSEGPAISTERRSISYGQLAARVTRAPLAPVAAQTGSGEVRAISLSDPIALVRAVLAVELAGGIPLVCDSRWSAEHTAAVVTELGTSDETARSGEFAFASFTSGSTGRPRAVVRSRRSWVDSFGPLADLLGLSTADSLLVPGPLVSSLSMFGALHGLWAGCRVLIPTSGGDAALCRLLADATVLHATPTVFRRILDLIDGGAEHRLRVALIGGAALSAADRHRAASHGIQQVLSYYGASELSFVAIDVDGLGLRAFPGVELRIVAQDDPDLGRVDVRSPYLSGGYLGSAIGPFERDAEGWATVGDLATIPDPAGEQTLELRGRGDGAILTAGATVVPEDVELVLRTLPGIREAVVFGVPHPRLGAMVCAAVETTDDAGAAERAHWQRVCREHLTAAQSPRRWFATATLPRTASGKPARAQTIGAVARDELRRLG
jgi:long-chain acyl-CoA synthetase